MIQRDERALHKGLPFSGNATIGHQTAVLALVAGQIAAVARANVHPTLAGNLRREMRIKRQKL